MFLRTVTSEAAAKPRRRPLALETLDDRTVPSVVAVNDVYSAERGRVLTVDSKSGVLANDFSNVAFNSVLAASQVTPITAVGSSRPLPQNTLQLNPNGGFTLIVPSNLPASVSQLQFTYKASNLLDPTEPTATGTVTINVTGTQQKFLAVGVQAGGAPLVNVYDVGTGNLRYSFQAFEPTFTGGVRVATDDLNKDGIDDIIVAPGPGGGDRVKVYDGKTLNVVFDGPILNDRNFRGGLYVAAGDVDGNGDQDLIVGAGEQGAPRVVVVDVSAFGPTTNSPIVVLADFYAYESTFRNGVRVAAGPLDDTGRDQIVTAPGAGGGPVVKAFSFQSVSSGFAVANTPVPTLSFYAGSAADRNGLYVATGNVSGTGINDIIVGTGGGASSVYVFSGQNGGLIRLFNVPTEEIPNGGGNLTGPNAAFFSPLTNKPQGTLLAPTQTPTSLTSGASLAPFSGLSVNTLRGGVTVTAADWNGDGLADVITGSGPGNPSRVRVFNTNNNSELTNFLAFDSSFLGGVNVG